jgi:DICT domain-containing protein
MDALRRSVEAERGGPDTRRPESITEFDAGDPEATLHALADEILKYRRAVQLLAKAIGWADAGAPFALIAPRSSLASKAHG